jgi:hypothetical protein
MPTIVPSSIADTLRHGRPPGRGVNAWLQQWLLRPRRRSTVHIEKGRGIHGAQARPFEANLAVVDGRALWTMKEIEDVERTRVAALLAAGLSIREIAEETGLHTARRCTG